MRSLGPLVTVSYSAPSPPWQVAVPGRPSGQTNISTAWSSAEVGAPISRAGRRRRRASRGPSGAG
eukprot:3017809-Alexandrium_andersonii.AAC.1